MSKSFRVRHGLSSVLVHKTCQGWRFEIAGEKRRYVTRVKRTEAEDAARRYLIGQDTIVQQWDAVPVERREFLLRVCELVPADAQNDVLGYLTHRCSSATIEQACERFYESMALRGRSKRHVAALRMDLDALVKHCSGAVADVTTQTLKDFIDQRCGSAGASRRKMIRATLVQFFRWCRKEGLVANDAVTAADRLPGILLPAAECRVLTRAELETCLELAPAKHRAWIALGAWAGLRPEEAAPTKTKLADGRRGVAWEDIDWDFGIIRIAAQTAKVNRPRIVPLCDALREFLWPLRASGAICATNPVSDKTLRDLGRSVFGGAWPADALRHSYGSCRNAQIRNLPQVAEEMGTSVTMLHRHYHNPRTIEDASEWFLPLSSSKDVCKTYAK